MGLAWKLMNFLKITEFISDCGCVWPAKTSFAVYFHGAETAGPSMGDCALLVGGGGQQGSSQNPYFHVWAVNL